MAVQRLRLCASTAGGRGSIPGWGTKSLHALLQGRGKKRPRKKEKKKKGSGYLLSPDLLPDFEWQMPQDWFFRALVPEYLLPFWSKPEYPSSPGPPHWSPCFCSLIGRPINSCHMSTDPVTPLLKPIIDQRRINMFLESELTCLKKKKKHVNTINITMRSC